MKLSEFVSGGNLKPPRPPKNSGNGPWDDEPERSEFVRMVKKLLDAGNKIDWRVPGQMGHVKSVRLGRDAHDVDWVMMKRMGAPYSKILYSLNFRADMDDRYQINLVSPKHYEVTLK